MKTLLSDFKSSIYNPNFYKNINNKPLRDIFIYILRVDLTVSAVYAIFTAIYTIHGFLDSTQATNLNLAFIFILGLFSVFIALFITLFILWILYGFIFGIIIQVISILIKRRLSYTVSVKTSYYAISLGVIIMIIPEIPDYIYILGMVLPVLIVILNLKNRS
jgi:hypothetical protein